MKQIDYLILLKQKVLKFIYWYNNSSIGHRNFVWVFIGIGCGYIYGTIEYKKKIKDKGIYGDLIYVDEYIVDDKNKKQFEQNYNNLNIHSFKYKGYEYTKVFKAIKNDNSPFSYLQLRLWKNKNSYDQYINNKNIQNLLTNLKDSCIFYSTQKYKTIVDDSIVRLIP
ncbi:conserved Plasmodium protein, unknown function [Plasmodium gaboni]|uniref:Uncharacterized protein n=1 Tax=Plasmodium gaboni TaxID=647221 RepID=A0ABY1UGW4_9APIC|nr:conserved Plasmodium protein, unknown function [Plasmodium gaboni]